MLRFIKHIMLLQLLLLFFGCAQLPEYARPHIIEIDNKQELLKKGFTYRQLTVDDFQALKLPANIEPHAKNIAAHACCRIRVAKDSKFTIIRGNLNQQIHYFGSIKYIAFEAVMIRYDRFEEREILPLMNDLEPEHEQIHFALMEIAAIKLTREAKEETKNFMAIQSTYKDAQDEISAKIRDLVRSANEAVLKEHTAFDEDTSLYFDPESQRRWLERVEDELLKSTPK